MIAGVEQQFGVIIDKHYPLMKFWNQVNFLIEKGKIEKENMEEAQRGRGFK